jgi:hypothetical protein
LPDIAIIGISSGAATPGRAPRPVLEQDARLGQAVANPIGLGPAEAAQLRCRAPPRQDRPLGPIDLPHQVEQDRQRLGVLKSSSMAA